MKDKSNERLTPKNAVVTGATHGIGKTIAERLLAEGFSIAICARNSSDLDQLQLEWRTAYPDANVVTVSSDFSQKNEVIDFAEKVKAAFPTIQILVNNAGSFEPGALINEPEGQLEKMMDVNLYSAYHLTRRLIPVMQEGSHIFNMCSVASLKAYPNGGAYSISKYALLGFSENLREELKPRRIRVTAICPGATRSRSWSSVDIEKDRIMETKDIADMAWACYTLSPQADVERIVMRPLPGDL